MRIWKTLLSTAVLGLISSLTIAQAQEMTDPFRDPALDAMKGKTIAYLPISLGFDMAQAWGGVVKEEAAHYGMKFVSQDPNWSTDAMAQSLTNLIAQKPDVIVTQNPDLQSLARLLKQANAQGIYVIQVNMQGAVQTDAFVGPDLIGVGEEMANIVANSCGKDGKSKKIAIVQGVLTGGVSFFEVQGVIIAGIEADEALEARLEAQPAQRQVLEREQEFGLVPQQQILIHAAKIDENLRPLRGIGTGRHRHDFIFELDMSLAENQIEKPAQLGIHGAAVQAPLAEKAFAHRFFPGLPLLLVRGSVRFRYHCWPMPITLLVVM